MIGLLCGSPVFSALAKRANPFRLIAVGLGTWTVATMACATSPNYPSLFLARTFVGVGEASFCALAAPFIDDFAPRARRPRGSRASTCASLPASPSGSCTAASSGARRMGWRWAFALESALLPVVMFCVSSAPIPMRGVSRRLHLLRLLRRCGARDDDRGRRGGAARATPRATTTSSAATTAGPIVVRERHAVVVAVWESLPRRRRVSFCATPPS